MDLFAVNTVYSQLPSATELICWYQLQH